MSRLAMPVVALLLGLGAVAVRAQRPAVPDLQLFYDAQSRDDRTARRALDALAPLWRDGYTSMIIDMARQLRPASPSAPDDSLAEFAGAFDDDPAGSRPGPRDDGPVAPAPRRVTPDSLARARLLRFLEQRTGKRFDTQLRGWRAWMWSLPYEPHPQYAAFKARIYSQIDRRMARFFPPDVPAVIRLDEIDWGGVVVNGIPPLYYPRTLPASDARYLRDSHVVFGLVVNGEARAYPKRILAWHEMARDRLGGVELHVVYCTLCGTVIPYESVAGGRQWRFGTSGLLYRSNKLMFDEETGSLWSTLEGRPVVGDLVGQDLALASRPVVTTTWGEWRREHPETTVLSLDTGHDRDYAEGAAYRDYFSHDTLYFQVPGEDRRLKNKAEVLTFVVRVPGEPPRPVAIAQDRLRRTRVYPLEVAGRHFLIVTSRGGANRVYAGGSRPLAFAPTPDGEGLLVDGAGGKWRVSEERLERLDGQAGALPRVPAQRAFWFGWRAQYPETVLVR